MKLLTFTDTHGSSSALKRIDQKIKAQNPDLLVCAGDVSIFEHGIIGILKRLNKLNKPILIVHGNHEDASTFRKCSKIFKNIIFIHKTYYTKNNILFLGYGGGGFAMTDKEFEKISIRFRKIIKSNKDKKIILVTHAPPYKTRLDKIGKSHAGNKSIRNFVENSKIDVLVCGHFHENFGKEDKIRKTKVLNPGPFGKIILV